MTRKGPRWASHDPLETLPAPVHIKSVPLIETLLKPLPEGAHILRMPYRPHNAGSGKSSRGSSRLGAALRCELAWALSEAYGTPRPERLVSLGGSFTPEPIEVGTLFHVHATWAWADYVVREGIRLEEELPDWATSGSLAQSIAAYDYDARTVAYTEKLFELAWPRIRQLMPTTPIVAEYELAACLGELNPKLWKEDRSLALEVVTARLDLLSYLGRRDGRHVVAPEDYKTKVAYGLKLPKRTERDRIDWQAALYGAIARARFKDDVHLTEFIHVRVPRVDRVKLLSGEISEIAVDRTPVLVPELFKKDLPALVTRAVRAERSAKAKVRRGVRPAAVGMANNSCFGKWGGFQCDFTPMCMEVPK